MRAEAGRCPSRGFLDPSLDTSGQLLGAGGRDRLFGGNGNDIQQDAGGRDRLSGENGDDTRNGGPGVGTCMGGPGVDTIVNCEVSQP